jgi:hypothetical protein
MPSQDVHLSRGDLSEKQWWGVAIVKTFYKKECQEITSPSTGGREDLSRDPAHFTVRVSLDFARGFGSELSSIPRDFHHPVITTPIES